MSESSKRAYRTAMRHYGKIGGKTAAANMTDEQRTERARKAASARWSKFAAKKANA